MSSRIQWVNLPPEGAKEFEGNRELDRSALTGNGVQSIRDMGRELFIEAGADKKEGVEYPKLEIIPDPGNVNYDSQEMQYVNMSWRGDTGEISDVFDTTGKAGFLVRLPTAGGDKFKFRVKDSHGTTKDLPDEIETRRILYYQVIKMKGVPADVGALTSHIEQSFLDPAKKHHLQLVNLGVSEIDALPNSDSDFNGGSEYLWTLEFANKVRQTQKDPFTFLILLVDHLADRRKGFVRKIDVDVDQSTTAVKVRLEDRRLWQELGPYGEPPQDWYVDGEFVESEGDMRSVDLPPGTVTAETQHNTAEIIVNLRGVYEKLGPTRGDISLSVWMPFFDTFGLSHPHVQAVCVPTRISWEPRDLSALKATLAHEVGHKVGMVLHGQRTHYRKNGNHCDHLRGGCIMYETHVGRHNEFCEHCSKSLRVLSMNAHEQSAFRSLSKFLRHFGRG